jgi:hypothetical protein
MAPLKRANIDGWVLVVVGARHPNVRMRPHSITSSNFSGSVRERQQAPRLGDPFELMLAAILEAQS